MVGENNCKEGGIQRENFGFSFHKWEHTTN